MKARYYKLSELIIPTTLMAFVGPGIDYVNVVFNTTTRWGMLLLLTFFLLVNRAKDVKGMARHSIFWLVLIYGLWGVSTVSWSESPEITLVKSIVFLWVSCAMMAAGYVWVLRHPETESCEFLWMMAVISLLSAIMGHSEQNLDTGAQLYYGHTGNPNFLGFSMAISIIWLLWRIYLSPQYDRRRRNIYTVLLVMAFYALFISHSRASLMTLACVALGALVGMDKLRKWLPHILLVTSIMAALYVFSPNIQDRVHKYALKSSIAYLESVDGGTIWFSREEIWRKSYELALLGGNFGGGSGINIGEKFSGQIGPELSTGKYGREHGNAQLAIMEQTGLIGLGLYLLLVLSILSKAAFALYRAPSGVDKTALGLVTGGIVGLLVLSVFEAWWVAPGAAESAVFWLLLGSLLALCQRIRRPYAG